MAKLDAYLSTPVMFILIIIKLIDWGLETARLGNPRIRSPLLLFHPYAVARENKSN